MSKNLEFLSFFCQPENIFFIVVLYLKGFKTGLNAYLYRGRKFDDRLISIVIDFIGNHYESNTEQRPTGCFKQLKKCLLPRREWEQMGVNAIATVNMFMTEEDEMMLLTDGDFDEDLDGSDLTGDIMFGADEAIIISSRRNGSREHPRQVSEERDPVATAGMSQDIYSQNFVDKHARQSNPPANNVETHTIPQPPVDNVQEASSAAEAQVEETDEPETDAVIMLMCTVFSNSFLKTCLKNEIMIWAPVFPPECFPHNETLIHRPSECSTPAPEDVQRIHDLHEQINDFEAKINLLALEKFSISVFWRALIGGMFLREIDTEDDELIELYLKKAIPTLERYENGGVMKRIQANDQFLSHLKKEIALVKSICLNT